MGWLDYYRLLEKYDGDLSKATPEELEAAARANPNDPATALQIAMEKYEAGKKEKMLKEYGIVLDRVISRNIWKLIEPHINALFNGSSIEDYHVYELDAKAQEIIAFLNNADMETEYIYINDNVLYDTLDISLAKKYDPVYLTFITTDVLLLKMLRDRANNDGLIPISDVIEIVESYRLLKMLSAISDVS